MSEIQLLLGDCLDKLKELDDNSVDSIVTDPPYGLSFMGKKWDYDVPSQAIWEECMRVLKPGGHILSFAGSRTYHRMAVRIEDAGFEIRDQIMWIYGSGFPKSHNIGKAVDKIEGNEREVVGENPNKKGRKSDGKGSFVSDTLLGKGENAGVNVDKGNSEWEGWGTALKPAHEPIVMARKPLIGTVANNVLEYGVGGLNIDGCRINTTDNLNGGGYGGNNVGVATYALSDGRKTLPTNKLTKDDFVQPEGRFPANIIFECTCDTTYTKPAPKSGHWPKGKVKGFGEFGGGESSYEGVGPKEEGDMVIHTDPNCPCYILDQQSGTTKSSKRGAHNNKKTEHTNTYTPPQAMYSSNNTHGDTGGASRFFYCPKASKKDRNEGCDGLPQKANVFMSPDSRMDKEHYERTSPGMERFKTEPKSNYHPTVKPTDLMAYLVRLVTPKGGIVLDPFMGSGSTGKACVREGMYFIGIEREDEYMEIAKSRIEAEQKKNKYQQFWEV